MMQDDLSQALLNKLTSIDNELLNAIEHGQIQSRNISLASGRAGICLYFMTRYQQTGESKFYDAAVNLIGEILDFVPEHPNSSFCAGTAGIGWLIQHGFNTGFFDGDPNELLADYDARFLELMHSDFNKGLYDFFHGGIGYALYFLRRTSLPDHEQIMSGIIHAIEKNAVQHDTFVKWYYYDFENARPSPGVYNLGLPHGIPGIISFLCMVHAAGFEKLRTRQLIEQATNFLLSLESRDPKNSLFPCFLNENKGSDGECRLGWCYGDLSVAVSLWKAASVLDIAELQQPVFRLLENSIRRKGTEATQIVDAGFCHGAAGLIFMYDWFHRSCGQKHYRDAANYYALASLQMAKHHDGLQGFKSFTAKSGWVNDFGLLEGIAGIGLCYSSLLNPENNAWSEWVLLG